MMDRRTPRMTHPAVVTTVAIVLVALCTPSAHAQELANEAFRIQYDESGIRSLRRAKDVHDTDYIAANGRLGRLLVEVVVGDRDGEAVLRRAGGQPARHGP